MKLVKHNNRIGQITTPKNRRYLINGKPAERVEFNDHIAPEYVRVDELREVRRDNRP